ncbi:MAG: amino acid permease [Chloroflexi bacterium]|nr:amino acid permease [Chloroflexota bacterium]
MATMTDRSGGGMGGAGGGMGGGSRTPAGPALFLRNATGLVKGWSGFDAFVYAFLAVNLVTLGMFYSFAVTGYVPDGSPIAAIVLSGVAMTFMCVAYAGLIAGMPRAGGDYVWQTRVLDGIPGAVVGGVFGFVTAWLAGGALALGDTMSLAVGAAGAVAGVIIGLWRGGVGFVLSSTGWWFILALWAPIYGFILKIEFIQPLAALAGWTDGVDFFNTGNGTFAASLIVIALTTGLVALGMAGYARIQRLSFWIGLGALAVMFVLMLLGSQDSFRAAFDREASSLFGVAGGYQATIDNSVANDGLALRSLDPLGFGGGTLLLIPFMLFWILYPNWGATLYGEVRGSGDFRRVLNGMLGGLWVAVILGVAFLLLAAKTFGWEFFEATNVSYVNYAYGYTTTPPTIPIWGYPPLLAAFLIDSHIIQMVIVVLFGAWFLGWTGTLFLSSTRMIFAAAFDRILPESAGRVSDRGVPWVALLLIMVPSVILSWLYAYNADFVRLTLDATLVIAVTFLGSAVAATILPWWKPALYNASPMARYAIAGIPLISIGGAVTVVVLGWVIYQWLSNALYGIGVGNTSSIVFLAVLYGGAAILFVAARFFRRSQGVDLDAIHAEIPAE